MTEISGGAARWLVKKHIAKVRQGKRTDRCGFAFGYFQTFRGNVDKNEQEALKKLAEYLLGLTTAAMSVAETAGELIKVQRNAKDEISNS